MRRPKPTTCYVYVLGSGMVTYVGWTTDLDRRVEQHNAGSGAKFTRGRAWVLLYAERHDTRTSAMQREYALKQDRIFRSSLKA